MDMLKDHIEEYINGEMSTNDRLAFEQLLKTDKELASQVELAKKLKENLDSLRLRTKIHKIGKEIISSEQKQYRFRFLGIAASVLVIISSAILFYETYYIGTSTDGNYNVSSPSNNETKTDSSSVAQSGKVDTTAWEKDQNQKTASALSDKNRLWLSSNLIFIDLSILRELENDSSSAIKNLNEAYQRINRSQYSKAIQSLEKVDQKYDSETISFLKGICYFQLKDYKSAKQLFAFARSKHLYHFEAEWNYLLCLYLSDQTNEAHAALRKITSDTTHPYYTKALALEKNIH